MTYTGDPDRVRRTVRSAVLQCFDDAGVLPGDEWGELLTALIEALVRTNSVSDDEKTDVLVGWIFPELERWAEEDWYDDFQEVIAPARVMIGETVNSLLDSYTAYESEREAVRDEIKKLPAWMSPMTDEEKRATDRARLTDQLSSAQTMVARIEAKIRELG